MKLRLSALLPVLCVGFAIASGRSAEAPAGPVTLQKHVQPLLRDLCVDCHNEEKPKGDFNMAPLLANPNVVEHRKEWEKVLELLESHEMPPSKKAQPTPAQRDLLVHFIEGEISKADCAGPVNPGKVTIRRLNKEEYRNTIRDLMGVQFEPDDFPTDEVGYGFDNIGDVLSLPPMLMEKYLAAAEEIVAKAIVLEGPGEPVKTRLWGDQFESTTDTIMAMPNRALGMHSEGEATATAKFPRAGEYTFRIRASADLAGPELPKLVLSAGGNTLETFEIGNGGKSATYELRARLETGSHRISLRFLNDYYDLENPDRKLRGDRNVFVESVEIESPSGPVPPLPDSHKRLIPRMPQPGQEREVAREILGRFLPEAYRRPVERAEVERMGRFVEIAQRNGGSFLEGIQAAFQAALCSPHFLFRWELDPAGAVAGGVRTLTDYEIASRLSYFLWSTMPDAELFVLAARGELHQPEVLEQQIARMVRDWRIRAFVSNFGGQWLQIRNIWEVDIDREIFPKWKDDLKGLMREETERFLENFIREDRVVGELLDADFTYLNEELATYYGIGGVKGKDFRRVILPKGSPRGGVVTMGSVLVSTSMPTRTSPVIRGKWILEQILGTPPPPPPPDVPPLPEQKQVDQTASVRQRLEQHRNQADCAGCHNRMDPLGFALENFDATGAWRDRDGRFAIDASGKLSNGTTFNGAHDLKQVLKGNKNFVPGLTEKLLTYALGRGVEHYDKCAIDNVMAQLTKRENRFSALLIGIVTSDPFLKRRPEPTRPE